jgi:hypothetical protein
MCGFVRSYNILVTLWRVPWEELNIMALTRRTKAHFQIKKNCCAQCKIYDFYKPASLHTCVCVYTGCNRRNGPDFGRVFLMLNYTEKPQNTYIQSWTVTEIMAREKCGLLAIPRTVPVSWQVLSKSVPVCGIKLRQFNSLAWVEL